MKKMSTSFTKWLVFAMVALRLSLVQVAQGQAPNQQAIYVSTNCGSLTTPNCYTANWNTKVINDAVFIASSSTVTTPLTTTDPPFQCPGGTFPCSSGGDVGKVVVGTYNCPTGNPRQCVKEFSTGNVTITTVNSAHSVTVSQTAVAASCTPGALIGTGPAVCFQNNFSWGTPDDTVFTSLRTDVANAKGPLSINLPCGTTTITQSAMSWPTPVNYPVGVVGCPSEGSTIIVTPDLNCSITPASPLGCLIGDSFVGGSTVSNYQNGYASIYRDVAFDGLGWDTNIGGNIAFPQALVYISGWSKLDNVKVMGMGWNISTGANTNKLYGVWMAGGRWDNSVSWVAGNNGCYFIPGTYTNVTADGGQCGATEFYGLVVGDPNSGNTNQVITRGLLLTGGSDGTVSVWGATMSTATAHWLDFGSYISGGAYLSAGNATLNGSTLRNDNFGPGQTASYALTNNGATVHLQNARFQLSGDSGAIRIQSGAMFDDLGNQPNIIGGPSGLGAATDSGTLAADSHSVLGSCTGRATASSTLGLFGTGPNATTTTCTSTTIGVGVGVLRAGTLGNLVVTAGTGGSSSSSGVVTVLVNGTATTIKCTLGTSTRCIDGTHSVTLNPGDRVSIEFTTQVSDTLAAVKALVVWD